MTETGRRHPMRRRRSGGRPLISSAVDPDAPMTHLVMAGDGRYPRPMWGASVKWEPTRPTVVASVIGCSATAAPKRRASKRPPDPVRKPLPHHQLQVAPRQPRHLLGEHRHALTVAARHARDVRAPEKPLRPIGVV